MVNRLFLFGLALLLAVEWTVIGLLAYLLWAIA